MGLGLSWVEGVHLADGKATLGKSLGFRALEPDDKATPMQLVFSKSAISDLS